MLTAPQLAPRNMVLTSPSSNCVHMSYTAVQYPNAPLSHIVYQVNYMYIFHSGLLVYLVYLPFYIFQEKPGDKAEWG